MDLREVQDRQRAYDADHWDHEPGPATVEHSSHHIAKLSGKLATAAEVIGHGQDPDMSVVDTEVIPDLLIFAARLANDRGIDLAAALEAREAELRERFGS